MKSKQSRFILVIACLAMALSLSACQGFWEAFGAGLFSVTGTAVNVAQPAGSTTVYKGTADSSKSLVGATITLTNVYDSSKSRTAVVASDGSWVATDVSAGKYRLTGTASGWTFIPKEIDITGIMQKAEPILAYETPTNKSEIMIVVEWKRPTSVAAIDVDGILVIDAAPLGVGEAAVFTNDFDYHASTKYTVPVRYTDSAKISLDRDVYKPEHLASTATTPLVETIRIKQNPWGTGTGQLRYYLNAFNSETLTGDSFGTVPVASTYATVTVMQPSHIETNGLLGIFNIALDSYEQTIGVVKIDVGYSGTTTSYTVKSWGNNGSGVMTSVF